MSESSGLSIQLYGDWKNPFGADGNMQAYARVAEYDMLYCRILACKGDLQAIVSLQTYPGY